MDPREMLSQHVDLVRDVVRSVALRQRLTGTTLEDLESAVWMRLVEHDYRAIRQYRGKASFRTFLRVVVTRLLLDLRASAWGRWRPSARARHFGKSAVRFEALLFRDGYSVDQALAILETKGESVPEASRRRDRGQLPVAAAPIRADRRGAGGAGAGRDPRGVARARAARCGGPTPCRKR